MKVCSTTNKEVVNDYVQFKCPACKKSNIIRSMWARETVKPYKCAECGFEGP